MIVQRSLVALGALFILGAALPVLGQSALPEAVASSAFSTGIRSLARMARSWGKW